MDGAELMDGLLLIPISCNLQTGDYFLEDYIIFLYMDKWFGYNTEYGDGIIGITVRDCLLSGNLDILTEKQLLQFIE